jgi:hypothetical protein
VRALFKFLPASKHQAIDSFANGRKASLSRTTQRAQLRLLAPRRAEAIGNLYL